MTLALSTPVTGAAQTGLTSPSFTLVSASAPDSNGRQYAVSAISVTPASTDVNTASRPFTITAWWPKVVRFLQYITNSGRSISVPVNAYKWVTRKGVTCHADLPPQQLLITTTAEVPAGADALDATAIRLALSQHFGAVAQSSAEFGNTCVSATP